MYDQQKSLLRAALRISSRLRRLRAVTGRVELPEADWTDCRSLLQRIHQCRNRNWNHAAELLQERVERALSRCSEPLQETSRQVPASGRRPYVQCPHEISRDLVALADKFEKMTIDASNRTLSVTTEPVVPEEINIGRFEIRQHWNRIGERRPYEVVAVQPNSAGQSREPGIHLASR
jgi:hypothetical protein